MTKLQKNDFIEIKFTAKTKDGEVFDSNIDEVLKKTNLNLKAKPFIFCLGQGMFLKGVDDFLIGKEIGKYTIELSPEKAFGKRDPKQIQMIPMKIFKQHNLNPYPGAVFNFDQKIAKVLTVSAGRTTVDFNNPLAGKEVIYEVEIIKKLENTNEKLKAFNEFLFKQNFEFKIENKKLTLEVPKGYKQFIEMFKDKYKEIFELDLEVKENQDSSQKSQ